MRELVGAVWAVFASGHCVTQAEFLRPDGLAEAIIGGLDPGVQAPGSRQPQAYGAAAAPPTPRLELPPNIKQCPACNILLEKVVALGAVGSSRR